MIPSHPPYLAVRAKGARACRLGMVFAGPATCYSLPMPLLLIILLVAVVLYLWFARRGTTLTRDCRWRLDLAKGHGHYRCAACGAETVGRPRHCLRPPEAR